MPNAPGKGGPEFSRSPSFANYADGDFKAICSEEKSSSSSGRSQQELRFECFMRWQAKLLDASRKSAAVKRQRLDWLVSELRQIDAATSRTRTSGCVPSPLLQSTHLMRTQVASLLAVISE